MPRPAGATRQHILDAAYRQFHRKGFARVNLGEIAAAAGVTKRSLYYHFRSKDDLLAEVLEGQHKLALMTFRTWVDRISGSPEAVVEQMFAELAKWTAQRTFSGSGFTRVAIELADLPGHPGRAIARRHKAMIEEHIAGVLAKAGISSPRARAREIYILLEGATALILVHGDPGYAESGVEAARVLIGQGRKAKPKRRAKRN